MDADAPKVLWALDFQFDSTVDGKAVEIASMIDEHTRLSVMNIVERSIISDRLVVELGKAFALWGGPPQVLRIDNGSEFISYALQQFCDKKVGISSHPCGHSVEQRTHRIVRATGYERNASTATGGPT